METDEVIKLVDNIYKVSAFWGLFESLLLFSLCLFFFFCSFSISKNEIYEIHRAKIGEIKNQNAPL